MRFLLALLMFIGLTASAALLYTRDLTVEGTGSEERSVTTIVFVPDEVVSLRLRDARGRERDLTILDKAGGRVELFFNALPGEILTLDHLDTPADILPARQRSGLLHTCRPYKGSAVNTLEEFRRLWKTAGPAKSAWESNVFLGLNRLGAAKDSLHIYHGTLHITSPGKYTFHTASTDASFLLIDGRIIASYPGKHPVFPALRGDRKGEITLSAGNHSFEYCHANSQNTYFAIAAYSRPGDKRATVIPPEMFLPVLKAKQSRLVSHTGKPATEFSWKHKGTLEIDGRQLQEYWLCDGTTAYFTGPGIFMKNGYTIEARQDHVVSPMPDDACRCMLLGVLKQVSYRPLDAAGWLLISDGVHLFRNQKLTEAFRTSLPEAKKVLSPEELFLCYQKNLMEPLMDAERYEEIEHELSQMLRPASTEARLEYARLLFYALGNRTKAEEEYRKIPQERLHGASRQRLRILESDMTLFSKGYDEALQSYQRLITARNSKRDIVMAESDLINFRNTYLAGRHADALTHIRLAEFRSPDIRLNPELMWLKAQLLIQLKRPRLAVWYAEAVLKMQPTPRTAAGAMLFLARRHLLAGKPEEALPLLALIIQRYSRLPEAISAEELLKELRRNGR